MPYVIHKSSRTPGKISYSGPTWDKAGIRDAYKETFLHEETAKDIAEMLSEHNPVGFAVSSVSE
jgi:hypothetical protein